MVSGLVQSDYDEQEVFFFFSNDRFASFVSPLLFFGVTLVFQIVLVLPVWIYAIKELEFYEISDTV